MSGRTIVGPGFRDDDGSADPRVREALAAYADGRGGEHAVLTALAASRLLVPVVAVLAEEEAGPDGLRRDKRSEMALPTLVGRDGRRAVIGFTSLETLARWRPDARPVPVVTGRVCASAAEEGAAAVVVDVAGPVPFVIDGARLAAIAAGEPVPEPYRDPDVLAAVQAAVAAESSVGRVAVVPGRDGDLGLRLHVTGDVPRAEVARRIAARLTAALPGRLRRGVDVAVS